MRWQDNAVSNANIVAEQAQIVEADRAIAVEVAVRPLALLAEVSQVHHDICAVDVTVQIGVAPMSHVVVMLAVAVMMIVVMNGAGIVMVLEVMVVVGIGIVSGCRDVMMRVDGIVVGKVVVHRWIAIVVMVHDWMIDRMTWVVMIRRIMRLGGNTPSPQRGEQQNASRGGEAMEVHRRHGGISDVTGTQTTRTIRRLA
jgi:hypothetical protein